MSIVVVAVAIGKNVIEVVIVGVVAIFEDEVAHLEAFEVEVVVFRTAVPVFSVVAVAFTEGVAFIAEKKVLMVPLRLAMNSVAVHHRQDIVIDIMMHLVVLVLVTIIAVHHHLAVATVVVVAAIPQLATAHVLLHLTTGNENRCIENVVQ